MHQRPYRPRGAFGAGAGAAEPPGPPLPVFARHPLPEPPDAMGSISRFIGQVVVVSTAAVVAARLGAMFWPALTTRLLTGAGFLLLVAGSAKWLWKGWTTDFPLITTVTGAVGLMFLYGAPPDAAPGSPLAQFGFAFRLVVVGGAVWLARRGDALTKDLAPGATFGLAGGALLMMLVATLPQNGTVSRWIFVFVLPANLALSLAVMWTFVNYVLANPEHDRAALERATARWRRVLEWREPGLGNPFVQAAVLSLLPLACALLVPTAVDTAAPPPPAESTPEEKRHYVVTANWILGGALAMFAIFIASVAWFWRVILPKALSVWLLYDGERVAGVYRISGCFAAVTARQTFFAAVLFADVVFLRSVFGRTDSLITLFVARNHLLPDRPPAEQLFVYLALTAQLLTFLLPALMPLFFVLMNLAGPAQQLHDALETTPPADLYPPDRAHTDEGDDS